MSRLKKSEILAGAGGATLILREDSNMQATNHEIYTDYCTYLSIIALGQNPSEKQHRKKAWTYP
jgi:hypothetical protein